jgi:outer membrane protein TolC
MMAVIRLIQMAPGRATLAVFFALAGFVGGGAMVRAQQANPSSVANPYFGSVAAHPATDETLKLSLDDAVRRGLETNLGLKEAEAEEKDVEGQENEALQEFLPTISVSGGTGVHQVNLAALGFGPSFVSKIGSLFPGGLPPGGINPITRADVTTGEIDYKQTLFSGPVIAGWKAAKIAKNVYHFAKMSARGEVVQQVATAYLHAIAAASEVDNAKALEAEDRVLLDQAHAEHEAGTAANLDELRAKVQLQAQEQTLIDAQNSLEKDLILLKREIGIDPGQKIALTDPAPYSELASQTPDEARATAYANRQDYQNLQNQVLGYQAQRAVYRAERLPTLSFMGNYGVDEVNGAGSHGVFVAMGTLKVPLFREARLRGDVEVAEAQLAAVNAQLADLRVHIDEQVRMALLDANATAKLVEVARSNVDLAARALSDETDRVAAGVDDNLPLVTAQATLAAAQSNLVESVYQYNLAKLNLARASGVIEQQYRVYLGK